MLSNALLKLKLNVDRDLISKLKMNKPNPIPAKEQHYEDFEGNYVGKGIDWTHSGDRVIQTPEGTVINESELSFSVVDCRSNRFNKSLPRQQ
jgi:hypothetical protein